MVLVRLYAMLVHLLHGRLQPLLVSVALAHLVKVDGRCQSDRRGGRAALWYFEGRVCGGKRESNRRYRCALTSHCERAQGVVSRLVDLQSEFAG